MAYDLKAKFLGLVTFAVMLAYKGYKTLRKAYESDAERTVVDYRLDCIGWLERVRAVPKLRHH